MRIALSVGDDSNYDTHVLVTHIPHLDSACPSTYTMRIGIEIPNINCPKCSLQAISVMTDKISSGTCCQYPPAANQSQPCSNSGGLYLSCANVVITGCADAATLKPSNITDPGLIATWARGEGYDAAWSKLDADYYSLDNAYPSMPADYCSCSGTACTITGQLGYALTNAVDEMY
jgi:hypothetical protein